MNTRSHAQIIQEQCKLLLPKAKGHIALYKGPPGPLAHKVAHRSVQLWFLSRYSHSELVINQTAYSSSMRDGGVRSKTDIDFNSGRWDLYPLLELDVEYAIRYHEERKGAGYDYRGVLAYPFPFVPQSENRDFCFEHNGNQLKIPNAHKLSPWDLIDHAMSTWKDI